MHKILIGRWSQSTARVGFTLALIAGTLLQSGGTSVAASTSLHVSHSTPAAGATDVPAGGFVSLTFDRPVVALGDVGVAGAHAPATISPATGGKGRWINTSVWSYQVADGLTLATHYRVATIAGVKAQDGSALATPYSFTFDTLRPGVQAVSPVRGTQYALPRDGVQIVFNQPVRRASAQAAFSLRAGGTPVSGRFTWNGALLATQPNGSSAAVPAQGKGDGSQAAAPTAKDTVMTFHPSSPLPLGARMMLTEGAGVQGMGGPLPMAAPFSLEYGVAGPLAVTGSVPATGSTAVDTNNGIKFALTAPVDASRIQKAVHVSPQPDYTNVFADDSGTNITVNGDFLPSTTYTISIARGAIGTAGQSLAAPYSLSFTTKAASPSVSLVTQGPGAVYNAYLGATIYARAVNLSSFTLNLDKLSAGQFQHLLTNPPNNWDGTAPAGAPRLATWQVASQAAANKSLLVAQPLKIGGRPVPPGYYLVSAWTGAGGNTPADHLLVLITKTSITLKIGQHQAFVWATDLKTGKPVLGESVRIVDSKGRVWATGTTNGDGVFQATVTGLKSDDSLLQHSLMAQLTHGADVAACSLDWNSGVGPWDFALPFSSYLQPVRMYLTTERPIYKPGQAVYFKGIIRQDNDGRYTTPVAGTPIDVTITDARNARVYKSRLALDRFGGFNAKLVLSPAAALGSYILSAKTGASSTSSFFQVAAYKKPDYAVTVISDRGENASFTQGETVGVQVRARYYFGAPLANAPVSWDLTQNDFTFQSALYPDFTFGDGDYADTNNGESGGQQVTQGSGKTDSRGNFHFAVPGNVKASPSSQQFTLEAVLTGPDNQQVAQNTQVVVHKSSVYVGVRPADYLPAAGKANAIRLVTVADDGTHMASGVPVTLKLYRRIWLSSFVRDSNGFYYWQDKHKDTLVRTYSARSDGQGKATVLISPSDGGEYVLVATATDPAGRASVAKLPLWVLGSGKAYVPWQPQNNDRIRLVADKQGYKPGDVAHILVTAPLAGMTALVTVERGGVLSHKLVTLPSNSSRVDVPIAGLYAPNVYVGVTLVKGPGKDTNLPVWKMGYISLPVDVSARSLHVSVHASTAKAAPGQKVTFTVHTADAQGRGVPAQLALSLVDKAVLALAASSNPSLMDTFYQERDLGVESAGSLTLYIDRLNLNQKVGSKGGSGGGGNAQGSTRLKFPDTAYWNPSIVTNAQGDASVTVTLPDNLTTWTLTAIGGTSSTLVGEASMDLISTKSLLLESALPSFLTAGDSALGGAVVDNLTSVAQTVKVSLHAGGNGAASDYHSTVHVPAGGSQLVQWTIKAPAVGTRTFLFSAQAAGDPSLADRLQVSLPVQTNSIAQINATSGTFRTSVSQTVNLPAGIESGEGDLTVSLYPSLVSGLNKATDFLAQYPYDGAEQTTSRVYGLVEALRLPRAASGLSQSDAANASLTAGTALQQLYGVQNNDGGWGWWPEDQSDPFESAWVLDGMLTLKSLGYSVDATVLKNAVNYVRKWALNPEANSGTGFSYISTSTFTYDLQSYVTYLLGRAGSPDPGLAGDLYTHRANILPFARAYLALAIAQTAGAGDPRLRVLLAGIEGAAQQSGGQTHWSDRSPDYFMMESSTSATSIILDALVRLDRGNPLTLGTVRWLMAQQNGGWDSTRSTALAIRGLVDYAITTQGLAGSSAFSVQVNGKTIGSGTIDNTNRGTVRTFTVPLASLNGKTAKVTLQQRGGAGQLAYTIALHSYRPITTIAAVEHGIVVGRKYEAVAGSHGQAGSDVRVVLTLTAPQDLYYLQIEDPIPAGAQPVNPTLRTTSVLSGLTSQTTIPAGTTDLSWYVSHVEQRDDKVALFANYLPAGTYQYSYQLHLTSAGTYHDLPTQAKLVYFPDVYGHGSGKLYTISAH